MLGDKFTLEYSPQFYDEISDAVRYITYRDKWRAAHVTAAGEVGMGART